MNGRCLIAVAAFTILFHPAGLARAGQVTFSITCDNRSSPGFADVLAAMNSLVDGGGEFMVAPGDVDPPADTRARLDTAFGAAFPWYPAVGNHEEETASYMTYLRNYYTTVLAGSVNPGPAGSVETTYSFDAGPVHIAVINEYWNGGTTPGSDVATNGDVVPQLLAWLAADLAATDRKWKLVFGHEPAFPQPDEDWGDSRHVGDSLDAHLANRGAFWSLLEAEEVVAYVCGHTHRFSHYRPPGGRVWQIDAAQARGSSEYDTFIMVDADETGIQFDVYRSLDASNFVKTDTWVDHLPGDADVDGSIDLDDMIVIARNWHRAGADWSDADFSGNGFVDETDLEILARHWTGVGAAPAAVPEPAGALLLSVAAAALVRRRGRGRQGRPADD